MGLDAYKEYLNSVFDFAPQGAKGSSLDNNDSFFMSFTYITPNYYAFEHIASAAALSSLGKSVIILLHDNNLFMHDYFVNRFSRVNAVGFNKYVENIEDEIRSLLRIFGAREENVTLLRSSDLWMKVLQKKTSFLNFYRLLSKIPATENIETDVKKYRFDVSYTLQAVMDIYSVLNSNVLPTDIKPINAIIIEHRKLGYYSRILNALSADYGYNRILNKPVLYNYKPFAFLIYNDTMPTCYSSTNDISYIVENLHLSDDDAVEFVRNFTRPLLSLMTSLNLLPKDAKLPEKKGSAALAKGLYTVLEPIGRLLQNETRLSPKELIIDTKTGIDEIKSIIGSELMYKVLEACNGEKTVSDIAKELKLQTSNASQYINKLRAVGFLTLDKKPRLKISRLAIDLAALFLE